MLKACLFDLDGVIVDTARYHFLAWKELAKDLNFDFTEDDNEQLKGISRMASLDILLKIGDITATTEEKEKMASKKNALYLRFIETLTPDDLLPGTLKLLKDLKKNNIKIGIGSASKNANLILEKLKIKDLFDVIIDGNKVTKAKPDPEVFVKGADILNTQYQNCLVFEDASAGIEAAKRAQMRCIGIGDETILSNADIVVSGLDQINIEKINSIFQ